MLLGRRWGADEDGEVVADGVDGFEDNNKLDDE